jgi:enamine deaminase RidA (YjgF/YER057c/UK114 family)
VRSGSRCSRRCARIWAASTRSAGSVNSAEGFGDQPKVINGFSDLMVEVFGEAIGKHARSAVGMGGLPVNIPVEIEMVLEVE